MRSINIQDMNRVALGLRSVLHFIEIRKLARLARQTLRGVGLAGGYTLEQLHRVGIVGIVGRVGRLGISRD